MDPANNTFGYADLDVTVGTNNDTGYQLTMSTTNTDLVNITDSTKVIETLPNLSGGYTDTTFMVNKWGYKKNRNTDNYNNFPLSETLLENNTRTNEDTANLRFATKIDYTKPSGTYKTTINFNAVANPLCDITITGDMQTFNPCPDMTVGTSGTLTDTRDGKSYTVAKLADGQIWMTSDLNLAGGTKLYSETSDVPAGYPESGGIGYYQLPASSRSGFSSDSGEYVYNTGNETTSQSGCTSSIPCNSYYSWLAATAGGLDASGNAVTGEGLDAAYSICPKSWRLPTSGDKNDSSATSTTGYKKGDFYKLATAYGADLESSYSQNSAVFYDNAGPGTLPNFLITGSYFNSSLYFGGSRATYWSSSSHSSTIAHDFYFDNSSVAVETDARRRGISVRCMFGVL
ncbi:hypothetical protein IJI18_01985 [Candidatus Saccharibacteria bacterium]|nr:hypothetical protein [Candidatus Saccharibacteria bacterium]